MAKDTKNNNDQKTKKHFFKDFKAELKKVIWPTPKQTTNKTVAVIVMVLILAFIVFVLDTVFDLINEYGINKIKASVRNNAAAEEVIDENEEETTAEDEETSETSEENSEEVSVEENAE